jgi:hypothetical protein
MSEIVRLGSPARKARFFAIQAHTSISQSFFGDFPASEFFNSHACLRQQSVNQ